MAGPVTKDTSALALGLGQIRIGVSATYINTINPALSASDSIGALAKSSLTLETEVWKHMSGFPQREDAQIVLSKKARIEGDAEELTPYNVALSMGIDPVSYTLSNSGQIPLGGLTSVPFLRAEMEYSFPDGKKFYPVFPRAQVSNTVSLDFQAAENIKIPMSIEAKNADSNASGGSVLWDDAPLGRIWFKPS